MIKICKTFELTNEDWQKLTTGFNICFKTNHCVEHLRVFYENTIKGYSYHALDLDDKTGDIRGYNSFLPTEYLYRGNLIFGGISGGTYVLPEYRKDVGIFMELMSSLFKYCRNEGMVIKVGVPNKNSFKYTIRINKAKLVGYLNYYILPVRPFNFLRYKFLKPLNYITLLSSLIWLYINSLISLFLNTKKDKKLFELNTTQEYLQTRFSDTDRYRHVKNDKYSCYYRIYFEKNTKVAYLMDFRESGVRSFRSLLFAIKNILKKEKDITMVLYVGTLNMKQSMMLKLPHRFDPKPLPLTVNVLNKDKDMQNDAINIDAWDFGLINFDAR